MTHQGRDELNYRSAITDLLGRPVPADGELRIWLDDDPVDRAAPEGWVHVRSAREACFALLSGRVVELSLDNDLNNACALPDDSEDEVARRTERADENLFGNGYQVIDFLEEQHFVCDNPLWPRDGLIIHTANPSARRQMERAVESLANRPGLEIERRRTAGGKPSFLVSVATLESDRG